ASTHSVKISLGSKDADAIDTSGWTFKPRPQDMPEALWSAPPQPFSQIPQTPSSKTIRLKTGYSVSVPDPTLGAPCSPIPFAELMEECLSLPGGAPWSPWVAPEAGSLPAASTTTVADIGAVMSDASAAARTALFTILTQDRLYAGANGSLANMAGEAAHLFSDAPLQQA